MATVVESYFSHDVHSNWTKTLKKEARSGDILARWGGEEFLIFLPETKLTDAVTLADRLRKKFPQSGLQQRLKAKNSYSPQALA